MFKKEIHQRNGESHFPDNEVISWACRRVQAGDLIVFRSGMGGGSGGKWKRHWIILMKRRIETFNTEDVCNEQECLLTVIDSDATNHRRELETGEEEEEEAAVVDKVVIAIRKKIAALVIILLRSGIDRFD